MDWKEIKADLKKVASERREDRRDVNRQVIEESGEAYRVANNGESFLFRRPSGSPRAADFFPSSGRWRDVDRQVTGGGGAERFLAFWKKGAP